MKRFVYPAVLIGLCLLMAWTHLQMFMDIQSAWVVGAILSTGIFFYVALARAVPAPEATFAFPMDISGGREWIVIGSSAMVLGTAAFSWHQPLSHVPLTLFLFLDVVILFGALARAYCWANPLGPVGFGEVLEDSGNTHR